MKNIDRIYNYVFMLFCFLIPISGLAKAVPNILIIILVVLCPFHSLKKNIRSIRKELTIILIFISIIILNTLIFKRWEDFGIISRLFYIPIILTLSSLIKNFKTCLILFIAGSFSILLASSILMGLKLINNTIELTNGSEVNNLLLGERPYLGFTYLISACFSFYLSINSLTKTLRILYFIIGFIFIGFIFIIAARIAVLSALISLILALFYFTKKIKLNFKHVILSLLLLILLFSFSGNLTKRFYINDEKINFIVAEPRYYIWNCAYDIIPKNISNFIFGNGYYQTENQLTECYRAKDFFLDPEHQQWFINGRFNTHNQFFDFFLSQGILSVTLFLFFFLYLTFNNRKRFFSLSLTLFLFLFFCVENVLTRQLGCMLVTFVLCFIFRQNNKATNQFL